MNPSRQLTWKISAALVACMLLNVARGAVIDPADKVYIPGTPDAPVTSALVAFFPFIGNANDQSGNGNNGVVNGATLTADRFGTANSAYSFDGSSDYIRTVDSASLNITGDLTIAAWIRTTTGGRIIFSNMLEVSPHSGYSLRLLDTGQLRFMSGDIGMSGLHA